MGKKLIFFFVCITLSTLLSAQGKYSTKDKKAIATFEKGIDHFYGSNPMSAIKEFEKAIKEGREGASDAELLDYRVGFVAKLFDDDDVTKEMLLEELDTNERETVFDIINCRVIGNSKTDTVSGSDPKD